MYHHSTVLHTTSGTNYTITPYIFAASDLRIWRYVNMFSQLVMNVQNLCNIWLVFIPFSFLICISHSGMKISMLSLVSFCLFFSLSTDIIPRQLPPQQLQASVRTFNRAVINNCGLAVRNTSYAAHLGAECAYLASLKKEPEAHVFGCQYITLLFKYSHTE